MPEDYDPLVQMDRGRKYSKFCEQITTLLPFEHKWNSILKKKRKIKKGYGYSNIAN